MFDQWKLSPPNGWISVLWEVAIVVLGVLIALGAQQLVDDLRWRRQVNQANDVFKTELGQAAGYAYERLAVQPCLTQRLKLISEQLDEPGSEWRGMPEHFRGADAIFVNVLPVAYRPPRRPFLTDGWNNALANGTINHVSTDRAMTLADAYSLVQRFIEDQDKESVSAAKLGPLATNRPLSAEARLELRQVVSELDRVNNSIVTTSKALLVAVKNADLAYTDSEFRRYAEERLKQQRKYRGACVTAPQLDLD